MLQMLNSEEVRLSILRGQVPDTWRVMRCSVFGAMRAVWKRTITTSIGYTILLSAISAWVEYFHSSMGYGPLFPFVYGVGFLLMGIIFSCIAAARAENVVTVFLPEGWLEFNEINSNLPNTCQQFWYAAIADIQLNSNPLLGPYLVLRYHEGKARKWYPDKLYAHSARMMIMQSILTDYMIYKRSFRERVI